MNTSSASSTSRSSPVGPGQCLHHGPQDRDGVGDLAAEREPHRQVARRGHPQRRIGRLLRDVREHLFAMVVAGVAQRTAALELDGVGDVRRRRLGHGTLEQPRRGLQRPEAPRGIGRTPEHGHDGGIAARWRPHQVLGDALIVHPASPSNAAARACSSAASTGPIASRAAAATTDA